MIHIFKIIVNNYNDLSDKFLSKEEILPVDIVGSVHNQSNMDKILNEYLVKRLGGKYFPLTYQLINDDFYVVIKEPEHMTTEELSSMHIGGINLRGLDNWAYSRNAVQSNRSLNAYCSDGTSFVVQVTKTANDKQIIARAYRQVKSLKPEWEEITIKLNKVFESYPKIEIACNNISELQSSFRDINLHKKLLNFTDEDNLERLLLHRANSRLGKEKVYHYGIYKEEYDSCLETNIATEILQKIFNIINNEPIKRDKISIKKKMDSILVESGASKYHIPISQRVKFLLNKENINISDVISMYMKYMSLGDAGQQTFTPPPVATMLSNEYGVRYEGYGSPINAQHQHFCSLFGSDEVFGSMGPFNEQVIIRHQDFNWSINPPFTEYYYDYTKQSIEKAIKSGIRKDILFFVKVSMWVDNKTIDWLTDTKINPYLVSHRIIPNKEFSFERLCGKGLYRLYKGMLWSVISPLGKNHPSFGEEQMTRMTDVMKSTVPSFVSKIKECERPYVTAYDVLDFLRNKGDLEDAILAPNITKECIVNAYDLLKNE